MAEPEIRYNLTLPVSLNRDLEVTAKELGISKAEAIRRALVLMKHAVQADEVEFTRDGKKQTVLLR
jgi:hypothetical protein